MEITDVKVLLPVVEEKLKALYGEAARNIKVQGPLVQKRTHWSVLAEFDDGETSRSIAMSVRIEDGMITRIEMKEEHPLITHKRAIDKAPKED